MRSPSKKIEVLWQGTVQYNRKLQTANTRTCTVQYSSCIQQSQSRSTTYSMAMQDNIITDYYGRTVGDTLSFIVSLGLHAT
jgi:hypothetical protein